MERIIFTKEKQFFLPKGIIFNRERNHFQSRPFSGILHLIFHVNQDGTLAVGYSVWKNWVGEKEEGDLEFSGDTRRGSVCYQRSLGRPVIFAGMHPRPHVR